MEILAHSFQALRAPLVDNGGLHDNGHRDGASLHSGYADRPRPLRYQRLLAASPLSHVENSYKRPHNHWLRSRHCLFHATAALEPGPRCVVALRAYWFLLVDNAEMVR